jgi:hypothetical protein
MWVVLHAFGTESAQIRAPFSGTVDLEGGGSKPHPWVGVWNGVCPGLGGLGHVRADGGAGSAVAEVVRVGERGVHVRLAGDAAREWAEGDETVDEHVLVPAHTLETAVDE